MLLTAKVDWSEIKLKMGLATDALTAKGIAHFPVFYTTANQQRTMPATVADGGAYFVETDIFRFTHRLGILRLHTEKLGAVLADHFPCLRMARAASPLPVVGPSGGAAMTNRRPNAVTSM